MLTKQNRTCLVHPLSLSLGMPRRCPVQEPDSSLPTRSSPLRRRIHSCLYPNVTFIPPPSHVQNQGTARQMKPRNLHLSSTKSS